MKKYQKSPTLGVRSGTVRLEEGREKRGGDKERQERREGRVRAMQLAKNKE